MRAVLGRIFLVTILVGVAILGLADEAVASATVNLGFTPATIYPGDADTLRIQLFSSSTVYTLTNAAVTLKLPTNVTLAATPTYTDSCGFSSVSVPANGTAIVLSGGSVQQAIAGGADGSCTFTVAVNSVTAGNFTATIPANGPSNGFVPGSGSVSGFSASENGTTITNATAATATLSVNGLSNLTATTSFSPSSVNSGEISTLSIVVTNPNVQANVC